MAYPLNQTVTPWDAVQGPARRPLPSPTPGHDRPELAVGVFIRNELLRQGLDVILGRIPHITVTAVTSAVDDQGERAARRLVEAGVDIIVTTATERLLLAPLIDPGLVRRIRILLLFPDSELQGVDLDALAWSDGAVTQNELSSEALGHALFRLANGEMPLSRQLAHQLVARAAGGTGQPVRSVALTPRERQTVALLANGMSNKEIARALGVSSHGAKRLVGSILIKLGAPNRTAAVVNAIKAGIIGSP